MKNTVCFKKKRSAAGLRGGRKSECRDGHLAILVPHGPWRRSRRRRRRRGERCARAGRTGARRRSRAHGEPSSWRRRGTCASGARHRVSHILAAGAAQVRCSVARMRWACPGAPGGGRWAYAQGSTGVFEERRARRRGAAEGTLQGTRGRRGTAKSGANGLPRSTGASWANAGRRKRARGGRAGGGHAAGGSLVGGARAVGGSRPRAAVVAVLLAAAAGDWRRLRATGGDCGIERSGGGGGASAHTRAQRARAVRRGGVARVLEFVSRGRSRGAHIRRIRKPQRNG